MNREEARSKAIDLLLGDNQPNADFYAELFENYNYVDPEMTPISPIKFGSVNPSNNIVITEEAYKALLRIREITRQTNQEIAYLIFGEEKPNGTVWLDTVVSTFKPSSRSSASFEEINPVLRKFISDFQNGQYEGGNKQVVCHGHSHGTSPVSDNFSFGDMISYVEFNNLHSLFKNRNIETMAMLLPPSGDFNFIMYENNPLYEGFYIFPTVYMRYNDGRAILLPAYQNGNYLVNTSEYETK
jgi:hypothetical protein